MESYRSAVIGREQDVDEIFETTSNINIRMGPGVEFEKLDISPLNVGTRLSLETREGSWCFVEVLGDAGTPEATGWVHGNFIRPL